MPPSDNGGVFAKKNGSELLFRGFIRPESKQATTRRRPPDRSVFRRDHESARQIAFGFVQPAFDQLTDWFRQIGAGLGFDRKFRVGGFSHAPCPANPSRKKFRRDAERRRSPPTPPNRRSPRSRRPRTHPRGKRSSGRPNLDASDILSL